MDVLLVLRRLIFKKRDLAGASAFAIVLMIIGGVVIVANGFRNGSAAVLWAFACLAIGALVGFLFGIPRIFQATGDAAMVPSSADDAVQRRPAARPYQLMLNTNLEQVS